MTPSTRTRPADIHGLPLPHGRLSHLVFASPELELRYYAPDQRDLQTPHDRDEIYVVITGRGFFVRNTERVPFESGDVLYAAADDSHRFEDFSPDFATWVVFYGPRVTADSA
jgi:Cupin domain